MTKLIRVKERALSNQTGDRSHKLMKNRVRDQQMTAKIDFKRNMDRNRGQNWHIRKRKAHQLWCSQKGLHLVQMHRFPFWLLLTNYNRVRGTRSTPASGHQSDRHLILPWSWTQPKSCRGGSRWLVSDLMKVAKNKMQLMLYIKIVLIQLAFKLILTEFKITKLSIMSGTFLTKKLRIQIIRTTV